LDVNHLLNPRHRSWRAALMLLAAMAVALSAVTSLLAVSASPLPQVSTIAAQPAAGAAGIGDAYYPLLGNGGYDVRHYTLTLDLDVAAGRIRDATATLDAVATQHLSAFNLDYRGPEITSVVVNRAPAGATRAGGELTVTPAAPIAAGEEFTVVVRYRGTPRGGDERLTRGWWATGSAVAIAGEPSGADRWYPVNGHPRDKATYTLIVTVPEPYTVVANGALASVTGGTGDRFATRTFIWENPFPTASYLVTFHAAELAVREAEGPGGIGLTEAFPPDLTRKERRVFSRVPEMIATFEEMFGPYPFATFGATVLNESAFDAALETQELVIYDRDAVGESKVAHELAHQWFGNSVSLERWSDIWLNEGFASYAQVLWAETAHGDAAARTALLRRAQNLATASAGAGSPEIVIGDPGPDQLTSPIVYAGGALTLHALRERIGDEAFFALLREWTARNRHANAGTHDFIALAEEMSGEELDSFFREWLYTPWTPQLVAELFPEIAA
jgi:aminopeptidase N